MSSFYDDASLVVIPSGYKTSKVYAEKPTDGSGDLAFTRTGDTATRVNSAGLIEKVRTNLLLQSQTFENASWAKVGVGTGVAPVVTANAGAAPDGTTTADRIVFNTGAGTTSSDRSIFRQSVVLTEGSNGSFYIKSNTGSSQSIGFHNGGQIDTVTATTSWQRFNVNISSAVTYFGLENRGDNATAGVCDVLVWGAQLQNGDIATDYIPTTTAAVSVGPVANVPRLDYLGSTCPRLLLEPQRTNLITYSEQLDNADWTKEGITITANATTSPDGYTNADKLVASASAGDKITYQVATVSSGAAYTASAYYKASEYTYAFMRLGGVTGNPYVIYNLATQAIVSTSGLTSSTITSVGNGWYRITATATTTTTILAPNVMVIPSTGYTLDAGNVPEFTGDGTSGGFVWGCQLEQGAYSTSLIPTLAASATRGADACSKTGISSLIGQTEGTLFYDGFYGNEINEVYVFLQKESSSGVDDSIYIQQSSGAIALNVYSGATQQTFILGSSPTLGQRIKIAAGYKANDFVLYVNGVQIGTDNSGAVPTCGALQLGSYRATPTAANFIVTKGINQSLLFKTRLTNAELAELTTL